MRRIRIAVAAAALAVIPVTALTACGTGPQDAASVVRDDGYTVIANASDPAQVSALAGSSSGNFTSDITSAALGEKGGGEEMVVVLSDNGAKLISLSGAGPLLQAAMPAGITAVVSGNILRIDGSAAAMTSGFQS